LRVRLVATRHALRLLPRSRVGGARSGRVHLTLVSAAAGERATSVLLRVRLGDWTRAQRHRLVVEVSDGPGARTSATVAIGGDRVAARNSRTWFTHRTRFGG
jgi:hypothetical protein